LKKTFGIVSIGVYNELKEIQLGIGAKIFFGLEFNLKFGLR